MSARKTVAIHCFQDGAAPSFSRSKGHAIVAVDVIRATTTAVTALAAGRRCFPVATVDAAVRRARQLASPLLVGELGGNMPYGFDLTNSPAALAARTDVGRPMVLLSTSGTPLICAPGTSQPTYVACLRNYRVQARHLAAHHDAVTVIGAGARGEFREEDQLCCAWIAEQLLRLGHEPEDERTRALVERWSGAPVEALLCSASVAYLRRTGQLADLEFVLSHVDDVGEVYRRCGRELVRAPVLPLPLTRSLEHAQA
ncbi:2-phosphosulfolactate phosphatase [Aggregicoccus sp. 17bor-14]|uniref:2-phosphosulfolactate phosphatase n=1 Tax=Myxococcaceae TaxID=31 RepID=UPI00129CED9F|nr:MULTISPECIES: 2-phosphosulfolactate phosphatase [Myxococcaceae]MBF5042261.1 2-phosphosulfolactate phosphatase [Simulacricoccus sp. 17bor-14]MRI88036.1 2-phosphosulfolactate phosphatase [Aggregicoccus sp. 17bor-14]